MTTRTRMFSRIAVLFLGAVLCAVALPASAADVIFLKIPGITGSSQAAGHAGWIEVLGLSHGTAGWNPPDLTDISVLKVTDATSPRLSFMGSNGDPTDEVLIDVCRYRDQSLECYYKLTLHTVWITGIDLAASSCIDPTTCGGTPTEHVTFTFDEIIWEYTLFDEQGDPGTTTTASYKRTGKKG